MMLVEVQHLAKLAVPVSVVLSVNAKFGSRSSLPSLRDISETLPM
jgi:hypothetical protein